MRVRKGVGVSTTTSHFLRTSQHAHAQQQLQVCPVLLLEHCADWYRASHDMLFCQSQCRTRVTVAIPDCNVCNDTLCNSSASIHRSCGAPNRSFCSLLSSTTRDKLGTPGGLGGNGCGVMRWRESTQGSLKLFFHNLGQQLRLLLQFHGLLLLLSLLFPLLILRIMLLQQLLRFFDLSAVYPGASSKNGPGPE